MKSTNTAIATLLSLSVCAITSLAAAAPTTYELTWLGYLDDNQRESTATDINNKGQVVGYSFVSGQGNQAFLWDVNNGMQGLGDLPGGGGTSFAWGINDNGQVVGQGTADTIEAFIWDSENDMRGLGDLPGGSESVAWDINNAGQVSGFSRTSTLGRQATVWNTVDGSVLPIDTNNLAREGFAINQAGHVVGLTISGMPFKWTADEGVRDLGRLDGGGSSGTAYDLNDQGQVVGWSDGPDGTEAFLWSEDRGMIGLGSLPGGNGESRARGINNSGYVVGTSSTFNGQEAMIWSEESGIQLLADLVTNRDDLGILSLAYSINDKGQVIGSGSSLDGRGQAFLLTPTNEVPLPAAAYLFVPAVLRLVRRKQHLDQ